MSYQKTLYTKGTVTYKDLDLNFKVNPFSGDIQTLKDVDAIKQSIKNLLFTQLGEKPFDPEFGGDLGDLLFEPLDEITKLELTDAITRTIVQYEPRIRIVSLVVSNLDNQNALNVELTFNLVNFATPQRINILLTRTR